MAQGQARSRFGSLTVTARSSASQASQASQASGSASSIHLPMVIQWNGAGPTTEDTNRSKTDPQMWFQTPKTKEPVKSSQSSESNDQNLGQAGTKLQTLFVGLPSIHLVNNSYPGRNRQGGLVRGPFLAYNVGRSQTQERSAKEIAAL